MPNKWVYLFDEVDQAEKYVGSKWENVRGLLGGKGANLAEMTRIEVPVLPGFTITTEACNAYLASGKTFPEGMWDQVLLAVADLEKESGKKFGDRKNPLLVSCLSGAKFSMPGMMDTVLNIGLNDKTAKGLVELTGNDRFVYDSFRRLIQMFGSVVTGIPDEVFEEKIDELRSRAGVKTDAELTAEDLKALTEKFKRIFRRHTTTNFPGEPLEQLKMTIDAVFKSWNGKCAVDYRNASAIPHDLGTAVNIVTMVFGNSGDDSLTGVALTRNGTTGENRVEGDYLINAQGEDVVAGIRQTHDLSQLKSEMPDIYAQFEQIVRRLEKHYREMQDVEFTVEKGKLWMLQTRSGKRTAQAAVRIAVEMAVEKLISKQEAVLRITPEQVDPQFEREAKAAAKAKGAMLATGLNVSPGAAVGIVAFDADLAEMWAKEDNKAVINIKKRIKTKNISKKKKEVIQRKKFVKQPKESFNKNVFINCPFDERYKPLLDALIFIIVYCGFAPRISSESSDSLQVRLSKIKDLIKDSRYSIHDLSRMEANRKGDLSRFNMPFELGIDFGCRVFGHKKTSSKKCLILETERYRYAHSISDLAGIDIRAHKEDPEELIYEVRNWIRNNLGITVISGTELWRKYLIFSGYFKQIMEEEGFKQKDIENMETNEYIYFIKKWMTGR